jgi:hypothetical protein
VTGIEEPVYAYGKFSHMRVKRSDAIFRMLLIASNPAKYGRMGPVANKKREEQLRAQILEEMKLAEPDVEQVREEVLRRLDAIQRHAVRSGERVELPDGRTVRPEEAQAMGYEVTATGDPQAPYKAEFKGPSFTPLPRPSQRRGDEEGGGESRGEAA